MDDIKDFFKAPLRRVKLHAPATSGMFVTKEDPSRQFSRRDHPPEMSEAGTSGITYAEEIREKEKRMYRDMPFRSLSSLPTEYSIEGLSSICLEDQQGLVDTEELVQVYDKYPFRRKDNNNLTINEVKEDVLYSLNNQEVTIIEGPTGCGKTTQVPQWILDDCQEKRRHCNIVVTQPRRIAAISIAKRVAHERNWDLGDVVGYQVGLDRKSGVDTRLHYVTTGVLLQKFVNDKHMNAYTHVILDEIHERGQEMDFLLLVVRKLLFSNSHKVKVILMSATFNVKEFSEYFALPSLNWEPAQRVKVNQKSKFTVKIHYLDQLKKFQTNMHVKFEEPCITRAGYDLVIRLLNVFELMDEQEKHLDAEESAPSVLVFLPGINEIDELFNCLRDKEYRAKVAGAECSDRAWWVVPLHSTITSDEQAKVFKKAPPGQRKIILSTNIAESSITVPDIKYVIDFCLMKVLVGDPHTNFTSLQLQWASRTNCTQRSGRAGRVRDGRVYRLVPQHFYEEQMCEECPPEMERCPLERLVLLSKMLDMGSPKEILALAMHPPDLSNIRNTVLVLKEIGGLLRTLDGEVSLEDGDITYLGRIMAKLPVDVRVSKLMVLGYIFNCLEETVIMGAAMSVKPVFSSPFQERMNAYNSKLTWADGSTSDCIAFLNVYRVWRFNKNTQSRRAQDEGHWARNMYLQVRSLRELDDMVRELSRRLSREGLEYQQSTQRLSAETALILKTLITGAFYPHYFIQSGGDDGKERDALRALGGEDPCSTVYLKDFPLEQPGKLYAPVLKEVFKKYTREDAQVFFDTNACKVYLKYPNTREQSNQDSRKSPNIPGRVPLPVYKAIKVRQLNLPITFRTLPKDKAAALAAAMKTENGGWMVPRFPEIDRSCFFFYVTHMVDCGRFYVRNVEDEADYRLVVGALNAQPLLAVTQDVRVGQLYAAPYDDNNYYRAVVHKITPNKDIWVKFIDFGNYGCVNASSLREVPDGACTEFPPLAMECTLAETAPSLMKEQAGVWSAEAKNLMIQFIKSDRLMARVYSVAHGVVSIRALANEVDVSDLMVKRGLARVVEESYESKLNHDIRLTAQDLTLAQIKAMSAQQNESACKQLYEPSVPKHDGDYGDTVHLKGPYSPLEVSVQSIMYGSRSKNVHIENSSVNSVLLNTEPQDPFQKLMVAASVGQNQSGERLTLRNTTLMPNFPGLPALLAMLFCPSMELRRDPTGSRYVSVLCGLGPLENNRTMFPDHDMLVSIDAYMDNEDLENINHVRHLMDLMMYCPEGHDQPNPEISSVDKVPLMVRNTVVKLLTRRRGHRPLCAIPTEWEWNTVPLEEVQIACSEDSFQNRGIYPLHNALTLKKLDADLLKQLFENNNKLHDLVTRHVTSANKVEMACELCGTGPMDMMTLRIHLNGQTHRCKEEDFAHLQF